jgi:hypothetical protein
MDSLSINIPKENSIAQTLIHLIDKLDTFRIKTHLRIVEAQLRRNNVDHLPAELKSARESNLDRLHEYWSTGVFPKNLDFKGKFVPYFKDAVGTPCAMAYLIEESGNRDLVNEVAATNNYVYINDIKSGPVLEWINTSGLTQAEAARVQPTYGGGFGSTPSLLNTIIQNLPVIASIVSFLILEVFAFKISAWIGEEKSGRRLTSILYFTINSLLLSAVVYLIVINILNTIRYGSIYL